MLSPARRNGLPIVEEWDVAETRRSVRSSNLAPGAALARAMLVLAAMLVLGACASTEITDERMNSKAGDTPKPDQLIVFNFATSPDEVKLEHGLVADVRELVDREPRTAQEKKIGNAVANALATKLVAYLREDGLPAVRAMDVVEPRVTPLQVKGQTCRSTKATGQGGLSSGSDWGAARWRRGCNCTSRSAAVPNCWNR